MSRARLIFVIFFLTAVLIATIEVRTASRRTFYKYRAAVVEQKKLKQQLWQKQIRLESLISPEAIHRQAESNKQHQ